MAVVMLFLLTVLAVVLMLVWRALRHTRRADFIHPLRRRRRGWLRRRLWQLTVARSNRQRVYIHRPAQQAFVLRTQALQRRQPVGQHALQSHA